MFVKNIKRYIYSAYNLIAENQCLLMEIEYEDRVRNFD